MILDYVEMRDTPDRGVGLHTTRSIPRGTIVMMECSRCSRISRRAARRSARWSFIQSHAPITRSTFPDFLEPCDPRIYFGNHSCNANVLDTGLGFDLAVRDIPAGTELTFDYRCFFDSTIDFPCRCGEPECGGRIRCLHNRPDLEEAWRSRIRNAFRGFAVAPQPLLDSGYVGQTLRGLLPRPIVVSELGERVAGGPKIESRGPDLIDLYMSRNP